MLKGNWRKHREIVRLGAIASGLLFAAVALYGLGVLVGQNLGYYDAQADGYASQYPYDTDKRVNECFTQSDIAAAKQCAQDAIAAGRENHRGEQELSAQRQMAKWALWLLIFTAGQSVLGFLGFLVLLITIRQGREANAIALDMGEAQVRAYVQITGGTLRLSRGDPGLVDKRWKPLIKITVKNSGQSPARWFRHSISIRHYPPMHNQFRGVLSTAFRSWGRDIGVGDIETFGQLIGSCSLEDKVVESITENELHFDIVIRYVFEDVFEKTIEDERIFTAYFPKGEADAEVPLLPHVLDKEVIEDLIQANRPDNLAAMREAMERAQREARDQ